VTSICVIDIKFHVSFTGFSIYMRSPPDSVGEVTFTGSQFGTFVRSFVRSDLVTTISHERLEQSW